MGWVMVRLLTLRIIANADNISGAVESKSQESVVSDKDPFHEITSKDDGHETRQDNAQNDKDIVHRDDKNDPIEGKAFVEVPQATVDSTTRESLPESDQSGQDVMDRSSSATTKWYILSRWTDTNRWNGSKLFGFVL